MIRSWDHRKLGMDAMPLAGSTHEVPIARLLVVGAKEGGDVGPTLQPIADPGQYTGRCDNVRVDENEHLADGGFRTAIACRSGSPP